MFFVIILTAFGCKVVGDLKSPVPLECHISLYVFVSDHWKHLYYFSVTATFDQQKIQFCFFEMQKAQKNYVVAKYSDNWNIKIKRT